jgi:cobalt-zinc-cadmium resistance protein CzcA
MIAALIEKAIQHRWLVLILVFVASGFGVYAFRQLPIDAYPDISAQAVFVTTPYSGRAPEEVERQVTIPIEIAMRSVPRAEVVRSRTIFGLSVVEVVFKEGTESYWARQRVQEKLSGLELPEGVHPDLGPLVSSCGEIYRYELVSDGTCDIMELRTLNDWVVIPRLLRVPGVADVTNFGGLAKQYTVTYHPAQLERYGLTLGDVVDAVKGNNASAGGSVLTRGSMSLVIRSAGSLESIRQFENIFVKSVGGTPIYLKDVATVGLGAMTPWSVYSKDRADESVEGIVNLLRGENPSRVLVEVKEAVQELNETELPKGVKITPFYDRQYLVDSTLHTVAHSVSLGITLVVLVLLLFLGRPSIAALVAMTIPFSLLVALALMYLTDIPIGLLSIGAIDFGIIVDGAVIVAENIARRLGEATRRDARPNVFKVVLAASLEVERPVFFSMMMVMVAYVPLLSLTSIEGLLFRPMALTMVFALAGALLFAVFVVPVLATIMFRRGYHEAENRLLALVRSAYGVTLRGLIACRWLVVAAALCVLAVVGMRVVPRLGLEFLPYMDEGTIWVRANFPEGTSLKQTAEFGKDIRQIVLGFPDVQFISVQSGRNDDGTEPFPPSRMEMMIGPKPREQWTQFHSKHELMAALGKRLREEYPTTRFNFTQPIIDMVTEDTNGTSANLAVELSGSDPDVLLGLARRTLRLLQGVPGAQDVSIDQEGPQAQLQIRPDRRLCARYNVQIDDVNKLINTALGGDPVGTLYEGDRRFDIVVKLDRAAVASPQAIGRLPVHTAEGLPVPLSQVAKIDVVDGQTMIARESSRRRLTVRCDIAGRDEGGFVAEAQRRFDAEIRSTLPDGYRVEWLGMFENLERARKHFQLLIPITVLLIFAFLWVAFLSFRAALLVLAGIPFACIGGILALYIRDMHINVSTGVGFAALFGIAIMDGVLMVRGITVFRQQGMELTESIVQGALGRLRPILITAIVAIFGLLPASMAAGLGSDVQRPLATVIVWGLFSSTLLTLCVLPVLYAIFPPSTSAVASYGEEKASGQEKASGTVSAD